MKADLHVHSKHSKRPSQWILQKIGCPESFTDPMEVYRAAKKRGMSLVTITDHNSIGGCLSIAHLPGTFISEEITTYFPEDNCKLHVLALDINEEQFEEIERLRRNVYELIPYLVSESVTYILAHPLYSPNNKMTPDHFEKTLLMFRNFELNGSRSEEQDRCLEALVAALTPSVMERLADKHSMEPLHDTPWRKNLVGGSDDHSSLTIARRYTEVPGAENLAEMMQGIENGEARVMGPGSTPQTLAHHIYSIAYQFYGERLNLERYVSDDIIFTFIDRFLMPDHAHRPGWTARLGFFWSSRRRNSAYKNANLLDLFRRETHSVIADDLELRRILNNGGRDGEKLDEKWFKCVDRISNNIGRHFADNIIDSLSGINVVSLFQSLGSAGALYFILAPYFVSFAAFAEGRQLGESVMNSFGRSIGATPATTDSARVAHFTDTLYEVNGVAGTLRSQIKEALRKGLPYTVITCGADGPPEREGVRNFTPLRTYELSLYPEQKLFYPPFLRMLDYCHSRNLTCIHSATPGPVGLAALAIARILGLPIVGTYHTQIPQYALYLTKDGSVSDIVWKYILWYYDQMDMVQVPSKSTAMELADRGISPNKIRLFPRGVDTHRFHPAKRNGCLDSSCGKNGLRLLYVGRVSKEKNLELLANAFKILAARHKNLHLVVVGDGPYMDEMRETLRGYPCVFTGYLEGEDLASVYASCDLFVFPSTTDTFGNVVLEAQASGIPVLVTDQGGPKENIVEGKTGFVIPGDSQDALLHELLTLVSDHPHLRKMGRAGREYAERRSFDKAFNEAWQIYSELEPGPREHSHMPWPIGAGPELGAALANWQ